MKDDMITIKNGIDIVQQRQLYEIAQTMNRALTVDEFFEIINVYEKAAKRVLKQDS